MNEVNTRKLYSCKAFLKRNAGNICTVIGCCGVVATAIVASKCTMKSVYLLDDARARKQTDELDPADVRKVMIKSYFPVVLVAGGTMAAIIIGNNFQNRRYASLLAATAVMQQSFNRYKQKVREELGQEVAEKIENEIIFSEISNKPVLLDGVEQSQWSDGHELFYESWSGRYFYSKDIDVFNAEYCINRNLVLRGYVSLNEFYEFLGIEKGDLGDAIGWNQYQGEANYGYIWIDFHHRTIDDGVHKCTVIDYVYDPTADYLY